MALSIAATLLILIIPLTILAVILLLTRNQKTFANSNLPKLVTLTKKQQLNHDTIVLTFQLPKPSLTLGITVGQHIRVL